MKRVLALILSLVLLMSAAGCVPSENEVLDLQRGPAKGSEAVHLLAEAVYPEMAPYPNEMAYFDQKSGEFDDEGFRVVFDAWREQQRARYAEEGYADNLTGFFEKSIAQF